MRDELKFAFDFDKLPEKWEGTSARLLFMTIVELENQSPALLELDTRFRGCPLPARDRCHPDYGQWHFPLPAEGRYIFLLFRHDSFRPDSGALFSTFRGYSHARWAKYSRSELQYFWLVPSVLEAKETDGHD